jgi:acetyl-CoA carboxylase biotin carboxyl carrier protein
MSESTERAIADTVRTAVSELLAGSAGLPHCSLRVRGTEVVVEVDWDRPATLGTSAPAPAPAVAAETGVPTVADRAGGAEPDLAPPDVPPPAGSYLLSPSVGTFYRGPEPGAAPFVDVGSVVETGQQIGIVEVMKLMIPVEAECSGRVMAIIKGDADPVEYGERLVAIEPAATGGDT